MLNEIIMGISMKLNAVFGDRYTVYANDVKQGLEVPCFFIQILKPEISPLLGRRSLTRTPFDVLFFPEVSGCNTELYDVAGKMIEVMDFITLPDGSLLHCTGISYEIVDDVLHFFMNVNYTTTKNCKEDAMETFGVDVGTKKG